MVLVQAENNFKKERKSIMNLIVRIKEFFKKDWSLMDTEKLIEERDEMLEHVVSYRKAYQSWDSALGRMGLKATIKKTESLIAEINEELTKRGVEL
jgi:hypothetical protein